MLNKKLTLTIVIPAFNEERHIGVCLKAIAAQTLQPDEVIVVDNNCTDATVAIAKKFAGVRIVKEANQGLIAARNTGMDKARSDILVRIDADTLPAPHWLAAIATIMEDSQVQAATGSGYFYDFPSKTFTRWSRNLFAVKFNRLLLGHQMLWGSNMAIRSSAWRTVRPDLCKGKDLMEDLDIAMHVANEFGCHSIVYNSAMHADISIRRATTGLVQNYLYLKMWPRTLKNHRFLGSYMVWPAVGFLMATCFPLTNSVARFYDGDANRWELDYNRFRNKSDFSRKNP